MTHLNNAFILLSYGTIVVATIAALVLRFSDSSKTSWAFFGGFCLLVSAFTYLISHSLGAVVHSHPAIIVNSIVLGGFGIRLIGEWLTHKTRSVEQKEIAMLKAKIERLEDRNDALRANLEQGYAHLGYRAAKASFGFLISGKKEVIEIWDTSDIPKSSDDWKVALAFRAISEIKKEHNIDISTSQLTFISISFSALAKEANSKLENVVENVNVVEK
ncbi:FtsB/FtsL family cell division protein [Vibrio parahaemolyticus]|uniref:hypothetical protein n=1 Tax=Vibrio parahaemolyticus TaxID=670 RepID=UPI0004DF15AE|nr:hypothetical protein [Vibrio parahaemolyticus]